MAECRIYRFDYQQFKWPNVASVSHDIFRNKHGWLRVTVIYAVQMTELRICTSWYLQKLWLRVVDMAFVVVMEICSSVLEFTEETAIDDHPQILP